MGYKMKLKNGMPYGDTKFYRIAKICLFVWVLVFLILPDSSNNVIVNVLCLIWRAIPFIAIGLFLLLVIIGILLYQTKKHLPDRFDILPKWIKQFVE